MASNTLQLAASINNLGLDRRPPVESSESIRDLTHRLQILSDAIRIEYPAASSHVSHEDAKYVQNATRMLIKNFTTKDGALPTHMGVYGPLGPLFGQPAWSVGFYRAPHVQVYTAHSMREVIGMIRRWICKAIRNPEQHQGWNKRQFADQLFKAIDGTDFFEQLRAHELLRLYVYLVRDHMDSPTKTSAGLTVRAHRHEVRPQWTESCHSIIHAHALYHVAGGGGGDVESDLVAFSGPETRDSAFEEMLDELLQPCPVFSQKNALEMFNVFHTYDCTHPDW